MEPNNKALKSAAMNLYNAVREMRECQRAYFANRDLDKKAGLLNRAKVAEAKVDAIMQRFPQTLDLL